jgi:hypothetical protein
MTSGSFNPFTPMQGFGSVSPPRPMTVDATVQRIRDINEKLIASSKGAGRAAIDAYANALLSMLDFQKQAPGATQFDWVSALAAAHARYIDEVSAAYIDAVRGNLK